MIRLLALVLATLAAVSVAHAETVDVKYRGPVPLDRFKCDPIERSSFIRRVCYDAPNAYMVILLKDTYYHYCGIELDFISPENLRAFFLQFMLDDGQRRLSLAAVHARAEPPDYFQVTGAGNFAAIVLLAKPDRTPDMSPPDVQIERSRRHNADDDRIPIPVPHRSAHNCGIAAEFLLPHFVAENHGGAESGSILLFRECSSENRLHAENIEVVWRDRDGNRRIFTRSFPPHEGGHIGKRRIPIAPFQIRGWRRQSRIERPRFFGNHDEFVRSLER
jgi:hypothetical protein